MRLRELGELGVEAACLDVELRETASCVPARRRAETPLAAALAVSFHHLSLDLIQAVRASAASPPGPELRFLQSPVQRSSARASPRVSADASATVGHGRRQPAVRPGATRSAPARARPARGLEPAAMLALGAAHRHLGLVGVAEGRLLRHRPASRADRPLRRRGPADPLRAVAARPAALDPDRRRALGAVGLGCWARAVGALEPGARPRDRGRPADPRATRSPSGSASLLCNLLGRADEPLARRRSRSPARSSG